ncbi:MAG TPA: cytochrome c biogenesis protein CcdA [Actinomycetota bacterium]|nr:cytochrome c biogenesis protein CcdA [Actinomycetota bacterium]
MADPTIPIAFLAGLVSFLSPCVLPLVPGYLSYMSGLGAADESQLHRSLRTGMVALAFVVGFTLVFVPLGATATLLGSFLRENQDTITRIAGVLIIVLGLVFMGVLKVPFFYREARFHPTPKAGMWGSVLLGAAFAFGWTPCIGATMGAVLAMAAGRGGAAGGAGEGALLLGVYSLGLGLPFVLAGLGVSRLTGALRWLREHTRTVNVASGLLLVAVGVLFITGQMFQLSIWMQRAMIDLNLDLWSNL